MDKEKERLQKKYNDYVKQVTPTHNLWWNMAKSFVTVLSELFFPNCFFPDLSPFLSLSNPLQYYQDKIPTDLIFPKKKRSILIYERNDFIIQSYK